MNTLDVIALAIGRHIWECESDAQNINCGMDCAREVQKALDEFLELDSAEQGQNQ